MQAYDFTFWIKFDYRHRRQQRLSIGMFGIAQHFVHTAPFYNSPQIHHSHFISKIFHHRNIVRDEQICEPQTGLQFLQQIQNLRLYRYVQRAGGLVANQQPGIDRQSTGDGDTLTLTTGEFVRVAPFGFRRQPYPLQQCVHFFPRWQRGLMLSAACFASDIQRIHAFLDNVDNTHSRIER